MTENFPPLKREVHIQIHKYHRIPDIPKVKKCALRHVRIKFSKSKMKRNFESNRRKTICHIQGSPIRPSMYFPADTLKTRKEWDDIHSK
jgi:hypothetical protein